MFDYKQKRHFFVFDNALVQVVTSFCSISCTDFSKKKKSIKLNWWTSTNLWTMDQYLPGYLMKLNNEGPHLTDAHQMNVLDGKRQGTICMVCWSKQILDILYFLLGKRLLSTNRSGPLCEVHELIKKVYDLKKCITKAKTLNIYMKPNFIIDSEKPIFIWMRDLVWWYIE